jgi:hypothetical protein
MDPLSDICIFNSRITQSHTRLVRRFHRNIHALSTCLIPAGDLIITKSIDKEFVVRPYPFSQHDPRSSDDEDTIPTEPVVGMIVPLIEAGFGSRIIATLESSTELEGRVVLRWIISLFNKRYGHRVLKVAHEYCGPEQHFELTEISELDEAALKARLEEISGGKSLQ